MWKSPLFDTTRLTVELGEIVEAGVNVWDFEYPSYYKGDDKRAFEQKVLDHYRFRQIGQETVGRWLHVFRTRVREIMPYYIQLYKSVELMEKAGDPFEAYNLTEEYTETRSGTGTVNGTTESTENESTDREGERRFSNTPQGAIENIDTYMTEATKEGDNTTRNASGDSTTTTTSTNADDVHYTMTRRGNIGVQPLGQEINVYRSALIDVDMKIIQELNDLFLGVY